MSSHNPNHNPYMDQLQYIIQHKDAKLVEYNSLEELAEKCKKYNEENNNINTSLTLLQVGANNVEIKLLNEYYTNETIDSILEKNRKQISMVCQDNDCSVCKVNNIKCNECNESIRKGLKEKGF